jgi:hypothetical protein
VQLHLIIICILCVLVNEAVVQLLVQVLERNGQQVAGRSELVRQRNDFQVRIYLERAVVIIGRRRLNDSPRTFGWLIRIRSYSETRSSHPTAGQGNLQHSGSPLLSFHSRCLCGL